MCACMRACVWVCGGVCVNKRDVENEMGKIIVENKLWCMVGKNGQRFSLSLKKKVYVKYGSNS